MRIMAVVGYPAANHVIFKSTSRTEKRFPYPELADQRLDMALPWTPGYWLVQAADAKALAEELNDPRAKQTMLMIAVGYEKLAAHATAVAKLKVPIEQPEVGQRD
jgi:hypothetical protein